MVDVLNPNAPPFDLSDPAFSGDGTSYQFGLEGGAFQTYRVEYSLNLIEWFFLGEFTADALGMLQIDDTEVSALFRRFYRLFPLP